MSAVLRSRRSVIGMVLACTLLLLLLPGIAEATVSISRAEISGDRLRIEGAAAPNRTITVDGVAMGTSDAAGQFRIERSGFTAPADCTVDVNDGSATATSARLSGCTDAESDDRDRGQLGHRHGHAHGSRALRGLRGVTIEQ